MKIYHTQLKSGIVRSPAFAEKQLAQYAIMTSLILTPTNELQKLMRISNRLGCPLQNYSMNLVIGILILFVIRLFVTLIFNLLI